MHKKPKPLSHQALRIKLDPAQLKFRTTNEIKKLNKHIGQERALKALNFGISINRKGYNIYAMGPTGIGKRSLIKKVLEAYARKLPTPPDWLYIHNFENPFKPICLEMPTGTGYQFQHDMKELIDEFATNIPSVFESEEYQTRLKRINDLFEHKQHKANNESGKVKNFKHKYYKEKHTKEKSLQLKMTKAVIAPMIAKIRKKYSTFSSIKKYLDAVKNDILLNVADFVKQDETTNLMTFSFENPNLTKYKVNLFVDHRKLKGAPIVIEENPNYSNLICRIEHTTEQGNLATNFTLIRPGSLHQANGGYLIMQARKLRKNKEAWEALKSALYTHQIRVETVEHAAEAFKPVSLDPMPIPLSVKIILLGARNTYYSLCQTDADFSALFKVPVDFDEQIDRNARNINLYSRLIGTIIAAKKVKPFNAQAVAEIIDYSSCLAEDNEKLSTHISHIEDLILESDYWCRLSKQMLVNAAHVKKAIAAQIFRMDRARELYHEDISRGFIIIKTEGKSLGQINCLSVRKVGNFSYGHPTRVTARVRLGRGKFIDIQREINLAGPMHTKAGLIISNFIASRFNTEQTFSLSASISFEQVYCWTDGDSASVGELCALLSSLGNMPINQFLAVTGSIDQYGRVQAVGGLNEKIEGFFDVCKNKGLSGKHGVIIPAINEKNLMLREDIIAATKAKQFFIYPIKTIEEAIVLLFNISAGKRNKHGQFPENTLYHKIEKRLERFSKKYKHMLDLKLNAP